MSSDSVNTKTQNAYRFYARFYPIISLLAYWIVWRGNIFRHIQFFREMKSLTQNLLDLATGDGSLTKAALFQKRSPDFKITCLDISEEMLTKAKTKLPASNTQFLLADVMKLPFDNQSWKHISCFGGFNSFPNGGLAMKEIARILTSDGIIRGSVLLMPRAEWRQRLVQKWIHEGYQTEVVTFDKFQEWCRVAKLQISHKEFHGDVCLFELKKAGT